MASSRLDQFIGQCSALAQQMGIQDVVIAAADPETQEARLVASSTGMANLKATVAEKFGFEGDEALTGWTS